MDGIGFFLIQISIKLVHVLDDSSIGIFNMLVVFLVVTGLLGFWSEGLSPFSDRDGLAQSKSLILLYTIIGINERKNLGVK